MPKSLDDKGEMNPEGEPVIENEGLPAMGDTPLPAGRTRQKLAVMAETPPKDTGGKNRMTTPSKPKPKAKLGDQVDDSKAVRTSPESYLRLRMRVSEGELSVQEVTEVEGPLVEPDELNSGFVYEVTLNAQRVAVGGIPDLGVRRSYPAPDAKGAQRGHHVSSAPVSEFNVRVPKGKLSVSALPKTEIALYRVKEYVPESAILPGLLSTQFEQELREVARLKGIKMETLSQAVQSRLRRAVK